MSHAKSSRALTGGAPLPVNDDVFDLMVELRRELHQHPELSWQEQRTAERIGQRLVALRLDPHRIAGTGLVAQVRGQRGDRCVALRADTDALPLAEHTGLPFASRTAGVMHACGHDGHSAMAVGAAALLAKDPPPCDVRLLWQPAEETGDGAVAMIAEGALDGVQMIFGGHLDRHYLPGQLVVDEGAVNASTDHFEIDILGHAGHGARPHEALDAVVVGSLLVTAIQTIVSREVDPAHPSVLSVGTFHAGSAPNVIAGSAQLGGTIRAQNDAVRRHLRQSLARIAQAIGQLHDAEVRVALRDGTPPLINAGPPVALAAQAAREVVGENGLQPLHTANMGGEDFAHYLQHVPGCYVRIGAQVEGRESYPAHSSRFDFDERALAVGAAWLASVARRAGQRLVA